MDPAVEDSERRRAKKTYVRKGGSLTVQEAEDLLDQKAVDQQVLQGTRRIGGRARKLVRRHLAVAFAVSLAIIREGAKRL